MSQLNSWLQTFLGFGPSVMLPVIIFIFGVGLGQKVGRAFRSALTIGIGFVGIGLIITLLLTTLGPVAQGMVKNWHMNLGTIDVGWPVMASMTWAWTYAALVFPVGILLNVTMIWLRMTKTLDVDLWNYWQFAFVGAATYFVTGNNVVLGLAAAGAAAAIAFVMADRTAPLVQKYFDLPGVSFPHLTAVGWLPIFLPIIWVLDKIPLWHKLPRITPEMVQDKFGVLGQPMVWGLVLGMGIAFLAGDGVQGVLTVGITMAAVMVILPKMVGLLMEGLIPISEAAREMMHKRFHRDDLYIGMDAALAIGHPTVIATSLILIPITLLVAFILPGNHVLPFVDLAVWPFLICLIVAMNGGDIIRSLILGTIMAVLVLVVANNIYPVQTQLAYSSHLVLPSIMQGHATLTNLDRQQFITWIVIRGIGWLRGTFGDAGAYVGLAGLVALVVAGYYGARGYLSRHHRGGTTPKTPIAIPATPAVA